MRAKTVKAARRAAGFTLIELLTTISIVALLAAILQPVFVGAKKNALREACQSNLRQIGFAFGLYGSDWDDYYPAAVDAFTRANNEAVEDLPRPTSSIPDLVKTLSSYAGGHGAVWRCPADSASFAAPLIGGGTKNYPSAYAFAGTSYVFPDLSYFAKPQTSFNSTELRVASDAGIWHCDFESPNAFTKTQNVLFGDDHVRFASLVDKQ